MIEFKEIDNYRPGIIEKILKSSYKGLVEFFPNEKQRFFLQWEKEDREAFSNVKTIGSHILFSCLDNIPIGYFSWDDRQYPIGIVGQNCILPNHQGMGYGMNQIEMIIKIFHSKRFREIKAVTGDHVFFKSAREMYFNCGFHNQKAIKGDLFNLIEYSKQI
jgi:hypothetical protein